MRWFLRVFLLTITCGLAVAQTFTKCNFNAPPTTYFVAFGALPSSGKLGGCAVQPNAYNNGNGPSYEYGQATCSNPYTGLTSGCYLGCCNQYDFLAYAQCGCACGGPQCAVVPTAPNVCVTATVPNATCFDQCVQLSGVTTNAVALGGDIRNCQPPIPTVAPSLAPTPSTAPSLVTSLGLTCIATFLTICIFEASSL